MGYRAQIIAEVTSWEDVTTQPHRFGGTEFNIGKIEFGHIHGDYLLDVPFTVKIREMLVNDSEAEPHHILPESGWISFYLRKDADVAQAIKLLRMSYMQKRMRRREQRSVYEAEIRAMDIGARLKNTLLSRVSREPSGE